MAKTNVFMDWKEITVTPISGSPIVMSEVTEMDVDVEDDLAFWQADGNKFPSVVVIGSSKRGGMIMGGDLGSLLAMPRGTSCTVTAKLYDAVNRAGTGCLTFTWTNAVFGKSGAKGQTNKYASGQVTFECFSPDQSEPMTIIQAT